jgi:hypothetical protein
LNLSTALYTFHFGFGMVSSTILPAKEASNRNDKIYPLIKKS